MLAAFLFGSVLLLLVVCADAAPVAGLSLLLSYWLSLSLSHTLVLPLSLSPSALVVSTSALCAANN